MNLKNNPDLIAMYRRCHSQAEAWPEIREGIRSVGRNGNIYRGGKIVHDCRNPT